MLGEQSRSKLRQAPCRVLPGAMPYTNSSLNPRIQTNRKGSSGYGETVELVLSTALSFATESAVRHPALSVK